MGGITLHNFPTRFAFKKNEPFFFQSKTCRHNFRRNALFLQENTSIQDDKNRFLNAALRHSCGTTSQNYMGLYTIKLNHNSLLTSKLTTIIEIDRDILLGLHHIVNWLKKCQEVSHGSSSIDFVVVAKTIDLNCKVHTIHLLHLIGWILDFCSAKIYSGMKR